jgi:hypothetical protein
MLGSQNHVDVLDGRTLEVVQTITTLGRVHHWKLWHDPNSKKDLIIGEDFNWSYQGSGLYSFDPSEANAVFGGMSNGDFEGNPYVSTPASDGSFIVVTVPAPDASNRDKLPGVLSKVDPKTWKVAGVSIMMDPLWAEVSLDNKYAYVTSGAEARIHKINLDAMKDEGYVATGPGPWGARISYDQTKLYTADKGEGPGYNQQGHTATIIDLQTMGVIKAVDIGLTTDHAILNPDGTEIWFTSNAEHGIWILDSATDEIKQVIKDPADGDIHVGHRVELPGPHVVDETAHRDVLGDQRRVTDCAAENLPSPRTLRSRAGTRHSCPWIHPFGARIGQRNPEPREMSPGRVCSFIRHAHGPSCSPVATLPPRGARASRPGCGARWDGERVGRGSPDNIDAGQPFRRTNSQPRPGPRQCAGSRAR